MFEALSMESIKKEIVEGISKRYGVSTLEGGFLDAMVGPVALSIWRVYQSLDAIVPIAHVDESSGGYIDMRCEEFGVAARKAGTKAKLALTLKGKNGTRVPKGTAFLTAEGLTFGLETDAVLGPSGVAEAAAVADEVGTAYNVDAGAIVRMYANVAGLESYTSGAAAGGTDPETDTALAGRFYDRLQTPATSGNAYHYGQWAKEVEGVGAAKVTPLWAGPGTVKVLVAGPQREPVSGELVTACAAHIEELRPIGAAVTVKSAEGLSINVSAKARLSAATTADKVRAALSESLDAYLKSSAFREYVLRYNRVSFLLLDIDGVEDFSVLTVNGGTGNVSIGEDQVPVLGAVEVTAE